MKTFDDYVYYRDQIDLNDLINAVESPKGIGCEEIGHLLKQLDSRSRNDFVKRYSWTLPCREMIDIIKKHIIPGQPLYDLMAGTGYWGKILKNHGIRVKSYDLNIKNNPYGHREKYGKIRQADAVEMAKKFGTPKNVLMSWTPYGSNIDDQVAKTLPIGSILFVIGEFWGGNTGSREFWDTVKKQYQELDSYQEDQWLGMHDSIWVGKKIN